MELSITYLLDGQPISTRDLGGKSGRVTMRFDYENQQPATFTADVTNFALTTTLTVETNSLFNQLSLDNVTTFEDLQAEAGAGSIQKLMQQLESYKQFYQGVLDYTAGVSSAYDSSRQLVSVSQSLQSGTNSLVDGISQLQSGGLQLSGGMKKFWNRGCKSWWTRSMTI